MGGYGEEGSFPTTASTAAAQQALAQSRQRKDERALDKGVLIRMLLALCICLHDTQIEGPAHGCIISAPLKGFSACIEFLGANVVLIRRLVASAAPVICSSASCYATVLSCELAAIVFLVAAARIFTSISILMMRLRRTVTKQDADGMTL